MSLRAERFGGELFVHGLGHFHPETVIDNAFLESLDIGTDDEWIMERVGIRTRRTVLSLEYIRDTRNENPADAAAASRYSNAQTGAFAARMALGRAGLTPADIGLVVAGGCSPQYLIPAEASLIAAELGIEAEVFDVNSACSSFAAQMHVLRSMRPESLPDYVLTVNVENSTRTVDYGDRRTAVLWGDGTAAAVISARKPARMRITDTVLHSDPSGWSKVVIPAGGHFGQNGPAVQAFAIRKTGELIGELREGLDGPENWFVGHQANLLMLRSVCDRAGVPDERHLYNVDRFGNCGAAGAPGVLSQNWDRFSGGDTIILAVVGSGLTWGGMALRMA